ncbi:transcriptional regulator [Winogradskya humida]|uniref:Transcriptional regulator n=2 Tax=Winogradskya humida TaxID=113566 RepID=A0ABQ3ZX89_9ACTN|nr:transcriptional regulator [Actinoplanes humidus]
MRHMALTIDITGLAPQRLTIAPSPLAELTAMLHVRAPQTRVSASFADRLLDAEFLWRSSRADFLLPADPQPTLEAELDRIDQLPDGVYVASALVTTCGSSRLSFRAPAPDRLVELMAARGPRQAAFAARLLSDPAGARAHVRRILEDCATEFFDAAWQGIRTTLAADARHKSDLHARHGLPAALAAMSPALALHGTRITLDKLQNDSTTAAHGLTFVPTVFGHPHLLAVYAPSWQPVVQYPITATPVAAPGVVQRRLDAFAHPVRLQLCRSLARAPRTTTELAEALRLTAPEVSRHLATLRGAGLLHSTRTGRYTSHRLDLTATAALGTDLIAVLLR